MITLSLLVCLATQPSTCTSLPIQPKHEMKGFSECFITGLQEATRFNAKYTQWKTKNVECSDGPFKEIEPTT